MTKKNIELLQFKVFLAPLRLVVPIVTFAATIQMENSVQKIRNCSILEEVLSNFLGIIIMQILVNIILKIKMFFSTTLSQSLNKPPLAGLQQYGSGWQNMVLEDGVCPRLPGLNMIPVRQNVQKDPYSVVNHFVQMIIG